MVRPRSVLLVLLCGALVSAPWVNAQIGAEDRTDIGDFVVREDVATAGDLDGAVRVLRFVQVSDAHILDDDTPYPARQEPLDMFGSPLEGAARPHDEYTDEVLNAAIKSINALHAVDPFDFVINTGDNIDNALENELMRFIDNWEGTVTTVGPISGLQCVPDGAYAEDASNDVTDQCTSLPEGLAADNTPLADGLPWLSAFGNHDGLIQGNVNDEPGFQLVLDQNGRDFLAQTEYVAMHFEGAESCPGGAPGGSDADDFGHGYANARERLCDDDPDNDGYYSYSQGGVRFIVLDTVNDDFVNGNDHLAGHFSPQQQIGNDVMGGYAEGSVDPAQYRWLQSELDAAADDGEVAILFSHHTVNSMFVDNVPNECQEGVGCLRDLLTQAGYKTGNDLIALLSGQDHVIAWIGGHTHQHNVEAKAAPGAEHAFWNVETSSLIDLPQEARTVEVWMTADGTKGFLRLEPFGHDFQPSKDLAESDDQQNPSQSGEADDQAVLLWFDIPDGTELIPGTQVPGTPPDEFGGRLDVFTDGTQGLFVGTPGQTDIHLNATGVYTVLVHAQNAFERDRLPHLDLDAEFRVVNATPLPGDVIVVDDAWVSMEENGSLMNGATGPWFSSTFTTDHDFHANGNYTVEVRYLSVDGSTLATEQYTVNMDDPEYEVDSSGAPALALPFLAAGIALALLGARRANL